MFQINFSSNAPIYEQLYTEVVRLAAAGAIKPGDKLGKINAKSPKWYLEHMTKNVFWSDEEERMAFFTHF